MCNVTAVRRKNKEYQSPSVGPHQKPEKQESVEAGDRTEKWRKGRKKKASREEKRGTTFPVWLTFNLRYGTHSPWKPCFLWQPATDSFDLTRFLSHVAPAGARLWPFRQWMPVSGERSLYKIPSRAFGRKKITQSGPTLFHAIINVSGALVLPRCWPPTWGMRDSPGGWEESRLCSAHISPAPGCAVTGWTRRVPVSWLCLPTVRFSNQNSEVRGHQEFDNNSLTERWWMY